MSPSPDRPHRALLLRVLAACVAAALVVGVLAASIPRVALDGEVAGWALFVSDLGGQKGTPLLVLGLIALLSWLPPTTSPWRLAFFTLCLLSSGLMVVAIANEHLVKEQLRVPRPSIQRLHEAGMVKDVDVFYRQSKPERSAELWLTLDAGERKIPGLPSSAPVRAHWVHEVGFSFPSGHSVNAFMLCAFFLAWGWSRLRRGRVALGGLLVFAMATAASRVVLGVHTPWDIGVGGALGSLTGTALAWAQLRWTAPPLTRPAAS